jgi:hypothetical protein
MTYRYVATLSLSAAAPAFLVAGAQGFTASRAILFSSVTAGGTSNIELNRVSSVVGGGSLSIGTLDASGPTPLTTAITAPTSFTFVKALGAFALTNSVLGYDLLGDSGPIAVGPGNVLMFQVSGTVLGVNINVYFEE